MADTRTCRYALLDVPPLCRYVRAGLVRVADYSVAVIALVIVRSGALPRPGFTTEAVQSPARENVTCVTPLGEEVASTS
jgi:hypothetical protein